MWLRRAVRTAAISLLIPTLTAGGFLGQRFWQQSHLPLYGQTIAIGATGAVEERTESTGLLPGSRVVASAAGAAGLAAEQSRWLAAGRVPAVPEFAGSTMAGDALLDLNLLARDDGVTVAGWHDNWRYVWPRDTAFTVSALARSGHLAEARRDLDFLAKVQPASGIFEARYRPDGSGPPDARGPQTDGTGWVLWALAELVRQAPYADRPGLIAAYQPLLDRSATTLLALTGSGTRLPPASADYWEIREHKLTLATCGAVLLGLRSAASLYAAVTDRRTAELRDAADDFQNLVLTSYAARGFPRHLGGSPDSVDLGVALLLRPFAATDDPRALAAWRRSARQLHRPAGGLAPGGSWRRDGISWTPATATYAMVEACHAPREAAVQRLRWLDEHRTAAGSLPEKVLADGRPASVAPLSWTAAAVLIALDELQRGC